MLTSANLETIKNEANAEDFDNEFALLSDEALAMVGGGEGLVVIG